MCYNNIEVIIMVNEKASVNVKIDKGVKLLAMRIFEGMGIDQTTAIDMYYRQVIEENRLPFQPKPLSLDAQLVAALEKSQPKRVTLPVDENGSLVIDKDLHPDIYDWAVNG
jgi:DNA-damage-inducible protein J